MPLLYPRLFDSKDDDFVCAKPIAGQEGAPFNGKEGGLTAHRLMIYISSASLALAIISWLLLTWKHLHNYTVPKEQRQIIRMVFLPVFLAVMALFSVIWYDDSIYIMPIGEVYEAFTIVAAFLLLLEFVCPDEASREHFFSQVENRGKKGVVIPGGSLKWFKVRLGKQV